jgi:hypothetical protein
LLLISSFATHLQLCYSFPALLLISDFDRLHPRSYNGQYTDCREYTDYGEYKIYSILMPAESTSRRSARQSHLQSQQYQLKLQKEEEEQEEKKRRIEKCLRDS